MRALISVSDKTGVVEFATGLSNMGWQILSTGGTYSLLKQAGINAVEVSEYTQSPEAFEGRVKTLHPKIHGGILHKRDAHAAEAKQLGIGGIDLVCVNLYPFKQTTLRTDDLDEIIENIDIGGPSMLRSAAKNHRDVIVLCSVLDYEPVLEALKNGGLDDDMRQELAVRAFSHTAEYDSTIANYLNDRFYGGFGEKYFIFGEKVVRTRYGENPHQEGALYEFNGFFSNNFRALKGEVSFNNITDINAAVKLAASFDEAPAVAIIKHANACGFAIKSNLLQSYEAALRADPVSAYGGVIAINGTLDEPLAKKINEIYAEVIIAANVTPEALAVFEAKKRIKIFTQDNKFLVSPSDKYDFKHVDGGFVLQSSDEVEAKEIDEARLVSKRAATSDEIADMRIAWQVAALTKSNCVVYVKDGAMLAIGMGMTSRVDAARAACAKAADMGIDLSGCVLASEAFFPFRDSINIAAKVGVKCVVEPGGSIRDNEVIEASDEHDMALYFTGVRHFLH